MFQSVQSLKTSFEMLQKDMHNIDTKLADKVGENKLESERLNTKIEKLETRVDNLEKIIDRRQTN